MGQACEVCGKKPVLGNQVTTRGRAKYLGGVGTKITGISRRQFKPNLRTVRVSTPDGTHKTMRVCARCLRSGAITKIVRSAPFKLPPMPGEKKPETAQTPAAATTPGPYTPPEGAKVRKRKRKKGEPEQPQ